MGDRRHIFFSGLDWDLLKQRSHYIALGLSSEFEILYCDPTSYSLLTYLLTWMRSENERRRLRYEFRKLGEQFELMKPPPLLPFSLYSVALNRLNKRLVFKRWSRWARQRNWPPPSEVLLWCGSIPTDFGLAETGAFGRVVYDCMDSWADFYSGRRCRVIREQESKLIGRADLVLASSMPLLEKCSKLSEKCVLAPNGVHEIFFREERFARPSDLPSGDGPVIGYVGAIESWFDWSWIEIIAEAYPDSQVVLIGPVRSPDRLYQASNVHLLGTRPHDRIPAYIDHFDVGLIPFKINPLTHAAHTIKLLEYLARGISVVAPPLNALSVHRGYFIEATANHLLAPAIERALSEQVDLQKKEYARRFGWDATLKTITRALEKL